MASLTARIFRKALRSTMKVTPGGDDFVAQLRRRTDGPSLPAVVGRGAGLRPFADGELGSVSGEWVGVPAARRHVLYLHGGYFVAGGPPVYRNLVARLATGLDAAVAVVDYRLAPEHPYPAAVDDAFEAYRALLATGADPSTIAVAGDSAGGGLTLALLLRAAREGAPMPGAAVCISPWVDLTCSSESIDANDETDDMLTADALRTAAGHYARDHDPALPEISPLLGELSAFPPLFVTVDRSEVLLDDARRLAERARAAGVSVELREEDGLFHVWPVMVPYLKEARATVAEMVAFLDRHLD